MDDSGESACFICRKHAGLEAQPPGGYLWAREGWCVCHAPAALGPAGTLLIELERHTLDYATLTDVESVAYGPLLRRAYAALRAVTGAERIYTLVTLEGEAHLHIWLVPRAAATPTRDLAYLASAAPCAEEDAQAMAARLREALEELEALEALDAQG